MNDGSLKVLGDFRASVLAGMPDDEWKEIKKAVWDAGGINNRLPAYIRGILAKAVNEYNNGVAKGDFAGHPFRGNQWGNASGGGGSMASGLSDRQSEKRARFLELEAEAEAIVVSKLKDDALQTVDDINNLIDGVKNVRQASEGAILQIEKRKAEAEYFTGDDEEANPNSDDYKNEIRAEERVIKESAKVDALLSSTYGAIKYATTFSKKDGVDVGMTQSRYRGLPAISSDLQRMRSELRDAGDAERAASRIGMSTRGAVARLGMLQSAVKEAIDHVENLYNEVEFAGSNVGELAIELEQGQ